MGEKSSDFALTGRIVVGNPTKLGYFPHFVTEEGELGCGFKEAIIGDGGVGVGRPGIPSGLWEYSIDSLNIGKFEIVVGMSNSCPS